MYMRLLWQRNPLGVTDQGLWFFEVGNVKRVVWKCRKDIRVELFLIHDDHCLDNRV